MKVCMNFDRYPYASVSLRLILNLISHAYSFCYSAVRLSARQRWPLQETQS